MTTENRIIFKGSEYLRGQSPFSLLALAESSVLTKPSITRPIVMGVPALRFLLDVLEQAMWARGEPPGVTHLSDRGNQYLSIYYTERLMEAALGIRRTTL